MKNYVIGLLTTVNVFFRAPVAAVTLYLRWGKTYSRAALMTDMNAILDQINEMGDLIQCGKVNP